MNEGYSDLAQAIMVSAIKDYDSEVAKFYKQPTHYTLNQIRLIESFFKSDYCSKLTYLNTNTIIENIRRKYNGRNHCR